MDDESHPMKSSDDHLTENSDAISKPGMHNVEVSSTKGEKRKEIPEDIEEDDKNKANDQDSKKPIKKLKSSQDLNVSKYFDDEAQESDEESVIRKTSKISKKLPQSVEEDDDEVVIC